MRGRVCLLNRQSQWPILLTHQSVLSQALGLEPSCSLHLPGLSHSLNPSHILPGSLTPALAPPTNSKQSEIGFLLPSAIISLFNKVTLCNL